MSESPNAQATASWPTVPPGSGLPPAGFPEVPRPPGAHHRVSHSTTIALLAVGLAVLAAILVVAAQLAKPPPPPTCPRFKCQGPPLGTPFSAAVGAPVVNGALYNNSQGFSLRYYPSTTPLSNVSPATDGSATGVELAYSFDQNVGGNGALVVLGAPEANATPQAMVTAMVNSIAPGAQPVYQLPGALVGYQVGVGEAFDYQPASSTGSSTTDRVIVMAAIRNGFGIWVVAEGSLLPDVTPSSPLWDGHPSPANLNVAYVADETVNSIRFPS